MMGPHFVCFFLKPWAPLKYLFAETNSSSTSNQKIKHWSYWSIRKKWKCNWKCWSIKRFVTQVCDFCLPPGSEDASKMHGENNSELWTLMVMSNHFIWDWMQHRIGKRNVPNVASSFWSCHWILISNQVPRMQLTETSQLGGNLRHYPGRLN